MVEKIISNLKDYRDIVVAAQKLVNEEYNIQVQLLGGSKKRSFLNSRLNKFIKTIRNSEFLTEEEKSDFSKLNEKEIYQLAREIILELVKKEIKNPLA